MTLADLEKVHEIDATVESAQYLHIDRGGEGLARSWTIESRPLREKRVHRRRLDDETIWTIKQIIAGTEEGIVLVADHDGTLAAAGAARWDQAAAVLRVIDLRVDFDFRRQGLASGLMFQMIHDARRRELRAVAAEAPADNDAALQFLAKLGFELTGLDTHWRSNHDLVKEAVMLFFYLPLL